MKVDYNKISTQYDDVRSADLKLISLFSEEVEMNENTRILDFGCGTGNYADKLQKVTGAKIYGVVKLVERKGYSMFHLIEDNEYKTRWRFNT